MQSESTWPPPPDVLNPLTEHDALLTALIRDAAAKPPMSRLRLVRGLREATGLDLRQCLAVVNDYCDRHGVFPQRRDLRLWLTALPALVQLGLVLLWIVSQIILTREIDSAPTRAARHLLRWDRVHLDSILLGCILMCCVTNLIAVGVGQRRLRRQAEEAKAGVSG